MNDSLSLPLISTAGAQSDLSLIGNLVRLEPLSHSHVDGLVVAASADPGMYQWSQVPQGQAAMARYVETALAWRSAGTANPFAILSGHGDRVIGSTRFWNIERWPWPAGHVKAATGLPDACEIGFTWFTSSAIRTGANREAKFLMLTHAFEVWRVVRVCLHTDERNHRSREAIERLGARFEGILRAHRLAADFTARNSVRFSILLEEWPGIKRHLETLAGQYTCR